MLNIIPKTEVAAVMSEFGGAFIKSLANTWLLGDETNRLRIERTFAAEFNQYHEAAEHRRKVTA